MRHRGLGGVSRIQAIQTASVEVFASRQPTPGSQNIEVLVFPNVLTMFRFFFYIGFFSRRWSYHIWSYLFIFYIMSIYFTNFDYIYNYLHHHRQSQDFPSFSAWEVTKMHPMRPIRPLAVFIPDVIPDAVASGHAVFDFFDLSRTFAQQA